MTKIKPLEWSDYPNIGWVARTIVGRFLVTGGRWMLSTPGKLDETVSAYMRDDETAKASAQAHFESLIRSTLEE